jgi:hypothetical protein
MAAKASLRYFLVIFGNLLELAIYDKQINLLVRQSQCDLGRFLKVIFLIISNVGLYVVQRLRGLADQLDC